MSRLIAESISNFSTGELVTNLATAGKKNFDVQESESGEWLLNFLVTIRTAYLGWARDEVIIGAGGTDSISNRVRDQVDSMPGGGGAAFGCRQLPGAYQATDTLLPDTLLGAVFNLEIGKPLWGLTL